jgi:hypothetical protein
MFGCRLDFGIVVTRQYIASESPVAESPLRTQIAQISTTAQLRLPITQSEPRPQTRPTIPVPQFHLSPRDPDPSAPRPPPPARRSQLPSHLQASAPHPIANRPPPQSKNMPDHGAAARPANRLACRETEGQHSRATRRLRRAPTVRPARPSFVAQKARVFFTTPLPSPSLPFLSL